jgi:hypothetical protein
MYLKGSVSFPFLRRKIYDGSICCHGSLVNKISNGLSVLLRTFDRNQMSIIFPQVNVFEMLLHMLDILPGNDLVMPAVYHKTLDS